MDRELAAYVVRYYSHLMTERESAASRHLVFQDKMAHTSSAGVRSHLAPMLSNNPEVLALTDAGMDAFTRQVAERIMREHGQEIYLNCCPKCGKIAKTPQARQCRFCFHDWH